MRQLVSMVVAAIIFIAGLWFGFKLTHGGVNSGLHEENTDTVVQQIQTLSDLVTVKYVVEKVVSLDDAKWYGDNRVLLLAHGIVKAGINLKRLKPGDVQIAGSKIIIHLPPPEITDAYLDEKKTRVIDNSTGLLRVPDKNLEQKAREDAVDDIQRAARLNGILDDAAERAQLELDVFLRQAGFTQVEFSGNNSIQPTHSSSDQVPQF